MVIVFGCISCLFGGENIGSDKTTSSSATIEQGYPGQLLSGDIERPLLRPLDRKKEEAVETDKEPVKEKTSNDQKESNMNDVLSLLRAERAKLLELENKYKKMEMNSGNRDGGDEGYEEIVKGKTVPVSGQLQVGGESVKGGTSTVVFKGHPRGDAGVDDGSLAVSLYTAEDKKENEVDTGKKLIERLSKIIKNATPLDLAECFYKLSEYDNALKMYKLLLPDDISAEQFVWAQYQIANCYRNMKKYDDAFHEYQRFVNQYPGSYLIEQASWYMNDINWWKSWYEKNALSNNQLISATKGSETK